MTLSPLYRPKLLGLSGHCTNHIYRYTLVADCRGVTLFQKVGGTNFRRRRGGGPGVGSGEGAVEASTNMSCA